MIHFEVTKFLISPDRDIEIDEVDPVNKQSILTTKWLYESDFLFFSEQEEHLNCDINFFQKPNILIRKVIFLTNDNSGRETKTALEERIL